MTPALQIHGSILVLLKKFVENNANPGTWDKVNQVAGKGTRDFDIHGNYDLSVLTTMRNKISEEMGISANDLYEKFGEYLVPDLLNIFKQHLNPAWRTFHLLENAEFVMHKAVRKQENKADPPMLNVSRVHDGLLIIDYYSKRRMASLAIGIIRGIAKYYNEGEKVKIVPTTNANDERVQIRIEFE